MYMVLDIKHHGQLFPLAVFRCICFNQLSVFLCCRGAWVTQKTSARTWERWTNAHRKSSKNSLTNTTEPSMKSRISQKRSRHVYHHPRLHIKPVQLLNPLLMCLVGRGQTRRAHSERPEREERAPAEDWGDGREGTVASGSNRSSAGGQRLHEWEANGPAR